MVEIAALILGVIAVSIIALTVLVKDHHSITNRLFVSLAFAVIGWTVTTYFSLHAVNGPETLFWIRWIMFFVVIQNTSFFLLVQVFPEYRRNIFRQRRYVIAVIYSVLTSMVAISPFLFKSFSDNAPQPGPGMALFLPHALIFAGGGIVSLVYRLIHARGPRKTQLVYFLAGTILMFTLAPIEDFIIPVVFKNHQLVIFTPLYTIIFSGLIAYTIVAHRLFDIRLAVTRSVIYILSLGFVIFSFGIFIFLFSSLNIFAMQSAFLQRVEFIGLALITALVYQRVQWFFTKVTNRVLYQDAYDPQILFNALNKVLVANIELNNLLSGSLSVINETFKADFSAVMLLTDEKHQMRLISSPNRPLREDALWGVHEKYRNEATFLPVVTADIPLQDEDVNLIKLLRKNDIALLACLKDGAKHKTILGYIILGPKKSGRLYEKKDIQNIEAIANEMVIAVQNALRFEEIEKFNTTLQEEVDNATRKLRHTNQKLQELDETKDDFISMASHQLRTPLTSVKGYLSMVLEGDAGKLNSTQEEMLGQAFSSSQRMVSLITDLLNISRLKTGKFVIEPSAINLADIIKSEVAQLTETAKAKNITLEYKAPAKFPALMLDEVKTRQVIMNFMDNAIYYTPQGGHINVVLIDNPTTIELRVIDDGIGVPRSEQHHLFSKFYRATNARKARPDGTGLGLFMAKKVIVAQGGSLIFTSQEGHGSTFGFSFIKDRIKVTNTALTSPDAQQKQGKTANKEMATPASIVNRENK